jgi:hypothetical protein
MLRLNGLFARRCMALGLTDDRHRSMSRLSLTSTVKRRAMIGRSGHDSSRMHIVPDWEHK